RLVVRVVLADLTRDVEAEEGDIALDRDVEQALVRPVVLDLGEPQLDLVDARGQTVKLVLGLAAARGLVERAIDGAADRGSRARRVDPLRVPPATGLVSLVSRPGVAEPVAIRA